MDERDAKRAGLEIHRREMAFVRGFVTCTNCAANYSASNPDQKVFCQPYGHSIDPDASATNIVMAEACDQWVPNGMNRNKIVHPSHDYRYDKWEDTSHKH